MCKAPAIPPWYPYIYLAIVIHFVILGGFVVVVFVAIFHVNIKVRRIYRYTIDGGLYIHCKYVPTFVYRFIQEIELKIEIGMRNCGISGRSNCITYPFDGIDS